MLVRSLVSLWLRVRMAGSWSRARGGEKSGVGGGPVVGGTSSYSARTSSPAPEKNKARGTIHLGNDFTVYGRHHEIVLKAFKLS